MGFETVEIVILSLFCLLNFYYCKTNKINLYNKTNVKVSFKTYDRIFLIISMSILAFMAAFRENNIGNDTYQYFLDYQLNDAFDFENRYEPGFVVLSGVFKIISNSPYNIIIGSSVISFLLYYKFISIYSRWYFFSVILFLLLGFFDTSMNIMRQVLAVGILLQGYQYILNKKFIPFVITVILSATFHYSAFIFIFAWWICKIKPSDKNLTIIIIGFLILSTVAFSSILNSLLGIFTLYEEYQNSIFGQGQRIGALFQSAILVILLFVAYYLRKQNRCKFTNIGLDSVFMLCFIGMLIQLLSYNMSVIARFAVYFNIFQIILIPNLLIQLPLKKRYYYATSVFFLANVYTWIILMYRPEWNVVYPFKFHFF